MVQPTDASKSSFRGVSPDYTYWCNCSCWTPEDAAGLMLGLEPRALNSSHPEHCMPSDSVSRYREMLELVRRAMLCGELKAQFGPVDFLRWTRKWKIAINADLASALAEVLRRLIPDKPESPRTADGKIILGVAMTDYDYDPRSPRNTAAGAIAEACARLNLKVSRETVLARLNEAKERFDWQYPDKGQD